jgi:two-component system nitrate/nitrite response regulator NarL
VATGGYWLDRDMVRDLVDAIGQPAAKHRDTAPAQCDLTPRELEIVAFVVKGYTNRDIAHHFSIAEDTVKRHLTNVFDKTGRSSRLELTLLAIDQSLVVPEGVKSRVR